MRYYGGKARNGKKIAAVIAQYRRPDQTYLEPFCGSLSVTQYVTGSRTASDNNEALITLFKELQTGWQPPKWITRTEFDELKKIRDVSDPLTAFAGLLYSYGGHYFGGYVGDSYPSHTQSNTLIKKIKACSDVVFKYCDYSDYNPIDAIIYCDPPYEGTENCYAVKTFDHLKFWATMREWSKNNTVLISEYTAPSDFKCVSQFATRVTINKHKDKGLNRVDCLFTLNDLPKDEWLIWS